MAETIHVKPISYKLDFDEEKLKKMRPFFKVRSGSFSRMSKIMTHNEKAEDQDVVKVRRKEEGKVHVELWDRNSSKPENLIGTAEVKFDHLSKKEGKFEDWYDLLDSNGKKVGRALLEINIVPVDINMNLETMFKSSIEDMNRSFKRTIEDMNRSFSDFSKLGLTGGTMPALTEGKKEGEKTTQGGQLSTEKRGLFDRSFEDMGSMFENTLEKMHNMFDDMTRGYFGEPATKGLTEGVTGGMSLESGKQLEGERTGIEGTTRDKMPQEHIKP